MEALFFAVVKARIASPYELASHSEVVLAFRALALLLEASLALFRSAFALSKAIIASLLSPNGASVFALRLRACNVLDLGKAVVASPLAPIGAFVLALQLRTSLALLRSDGNVSEVVVT